MRWSRIIALQPGRTAAVGRIDEIPVIALRGAPDQALAAWWTLALPALDRWAGLWPRQRVTLPLARKIAASVGTAEIVLLEQIDEVWMPLAAGDLPLGTIARSDAWLMGSRRQRRICCGRAGRCLYATGVIWVPR